MNKTYNLLKSYINIIQLFKFIVVGVIFSQIMHLVFSIYLNVHLPEVLNVVPNGNPSPNPVDPVRIWPSGVPQSMATIGSGVAVYSILTKLGNCTPRLRVLGALGASGASAATITYHSAIENPVGFNRFMYGLNRISNTGEWPSLESISVELEKEKLVNDFIKKALDAQNSEKVKSVVEEVKKIIENSNSFLPDNTNFPINLTDSLFNIFIYFIKPIGVEGHLDDLIGQQIIIHMSLFLLTISLILLFIFYILNNIFLHYKTFFEKQFNNKIIKFYIKYQSFLAKLSLIYLPIMILLGLLSLSQGLLFLIEHQIPYAEIKNVDLHEYISNK